MQWEQLDSQQRVLNRTEGVGIAKILFGGALTHGDVGWELVDGRKVEYEKNKGGGCDTCGYGARGDVWHLGTPEQ